MSSAILQNIRINLKDEGIALVGIIVPMKEYAALRKQNIQAKSSSQLIEEYIFPSEGRGIAAISTDATTKKRITAHRSFMGRPIQVV